MSLGGLGGFRLGRPLVEASVEHVLGDAAFFAWLEASHADIFSGGAAKGKPPSGAKAPAASEKFVRSGPEPALRLEPSATAAIDPETGSIAIFNQGTVTVLELNDSAIEGLIEAGIIFPGERTAGAETTI